MNLKLKKKQNILFLMKLENFPQHVAMITIMHYHFLFRVKSYMYDVTT